MDINNIDLLISIILLLTTIVGYRKGALRDSIQFAIWLPMFAFTAWVLISGQTNDDETMGVLQKAAIIFMVSYMGVWILDALFLKSCIANLFGEKGLVINKFLGLLTGFIRGSTVIIGVYLCLSIYTEGNIPFADHIEKSEVLPYIIPVSDKVEEYLIENGYAPPPAPRWQIKSTLKEEAQNDLQREIKRMFGMQ